MNAVATAPAAPAVPVPPKSRTIALVTLRANKERTETHRLSLWERTAWISLSAIMMMVALPPLPFWAVAFVMLVPLIESLRSTRIQVFSRLAFFWSFAAGAVSIPWCYNLFDECAALAWALLGVFWLVPLLLCRKIGLFGSRLRRAPVVTALFSAALVIGVEWFRSEVWPLPFAMSSFGSTQISGPLFPAMRVLGIHGVGFVVVCVNILLAAAWQELGHRSAVDLGRFFYRMGVAALLILSLSYMGKIPVPLEDKGTLRVGMLQAECQRIDTLCIATYQGAHNNTKKMDLLVWPEYAVQDFPLKTGWLFNVMEDVAKGYKTTFIYGAKDQQADGWHNTAFTHGPDGRLVAKTHKVLPLYMFDDGEPDHNFHPTNTPAGRLGLMVCYDSDFSYISRRLTAEGAELLVVPTMEKIEWGTWMQRQRLQLARARAMEEGRWVVRAASSGVSALISPEGEITQHLDQGLGFVTGIVHRLSGLTPYCRFGWMITHICLAFCLVVLLLRSRRLVCLMPR
jgi:apolipoprotein N-acyltransferase